MDVRFEMDFWTRILRDHAEFQSTSLAAEETEALAVAKKYMDLFSELLKKLEVKDMAASELAGLIADSKIAVTQFVQFKKSMLKRLVNGTIKLAMSPTFLNHMINEAMEYYRVLSIVDESLRVNNVLENIRLHKIWLPDASGHSKFIESQLDGVELMYIAQAEDFMHAFDGLFKKAFEMYMIYERTALANGALNQFNRDVEKLMNEYLSYLELLKGLLADHRIYSTGTFSPLVLDHMIREENYYLYKVRETEI